MTRIASNLSSKRRGFALLVTIVLVAFLVLILVGLATFTRVETQVAGNAETLAKARQNALFAMNVAIGRLQETAGPDARVTATSDFLNSSAANRDWTGVWSVNTSTGALSSATPTQWLVSGNSAPGAYTTNLVGSQTGIRLQRAGTLTSGDTYDRDVWVERERIRSAGIPGFPAATQLTIGTYAYHVSDQGVKASLSELPSTSFSHGYYQNATPAARNRLLQLGGRAPRGFEGIAAYDHYTGTAQSAMARALFPSQFAYADDVNIATSDLILRRPDYAVASLGLLVNPATGSLKNDLSYDLIDALGDVSDEYQASITATRANTSGTNILGTEIVAPVAGAEALYHAAPVVTQFNFQAAVFNGPGSNPAIASRVTNPNLETRARFFVEFWNPFTEALIIPNGSSLRVLISDLPVLNVASRDPGDGSKNYGTATVNIGTIYNNTSTAGEVALVINPTDFLTLPDGRKALAPGRIYSAGHPSGYAADAAADTAKQTLTFASVFRSTYWNRASGALSGGATTPDANMEFKITTASPTTIKIKFQVGSGSSWTDISDITLPEFLQADTAWVFSTDRQPRVGYHVRAKERATEGSDWLITELDYRRTTYTDTFFAYAIDDDPASYAGASIPDGNSASELATMLNRNYNINPQYAYDVALYELPRQEPVSMGNLQHLAFNDGANRSLSYALGNSWGDIRNSWFDEYYFSTVPSTTVAGTTTYNLPNRHLVRLSQGDLTAVPDDATLRAAPDEAARYLLVNNAFNINSTSVEAWKAVLGGLRLINWPYVTRNATDGIPTSSGSVLLTNPFFRFPQSAHELWDPTSVADYRRFYRQGTRALSQAQINTLATEIVAQIRTERATKGPFPSMREFLAPLSGTTGNILEEAIVDADANGNTANRLNYDTALSIAIDPRSPSAITAGDIMTALAPFTNTRSDTFVIRTYGAVTSPLDADAGNTSGALPAAEAQAWLEATVQRFPETVGSGDNIVTPTGTFGRKFRVTSFRWLTANDL